MQESSFIAPEQPIVMTYDNILPIMDKECGGSVVCIS